MNINNIISDIFVTYTGIDFSINEELKSENLLGEKLKIAPRDLVNVYMKIKKRFNISFDESIILNRTLKTYNDFLNLVVKLVDVSQ